MKLKSSATKMNCLDAIEHKRVPLPVKEVDNDGSFCGYASVFDQVDLGKDKVAKGAFKKSLNRRGPSSIRMLFQHDPSEPIGIWGTIEENHKGLWVEGQVIAGTSRGREVLELLRANAIDGLSIGFKTTKSRTDRSTGVRTILEADLWEISIVTFPMLPQARVENVKSNIQNSERRLPSIRQFEHWLTRDAGLTRSEARTVIRKGFASVAGKRDAACSSANALLASIQSATNKINIREHYDSN